MVTVPSPWLAAPGVPGPLAVPGPLGAPGPGAAGPWGPTGAGGACAPGGPWGPFWSAGGGGTIVMVCGRGDSVTVWGGGALGGGSVVGIVTGRRGPTGGPAAPL